MAVDLASLDSVRAAASEIAASYGNGIDVLIVSPAIRPILSGLAAVACTLGAVRSPEQGVETAIFLASADGVEGQGLYWSDSAVREPNAQLSDAAMRDSIWRQASELVGVPP